MMYLAARQVLVLEGRAWHLFDQIEKREGESAPADYERAECSAIITALLELRQRRVEAGSRWPEKSILDALTATARRKYGLCEEAKPVKD